MAYTPGLKRNEFVSIRKTRRLSIPGDVKVKKGDKVNPETIIASTETLGDPYIVNVAAQMGLDPRMDDIFDIIIKKEGDHIEKDEIIALISEFFGWFKKTVVSPCTGTIELVSKISGQVIIREKPIPIEINAFIPGKIHEILQNEGAIVETQAVFIQGIFGVGGENNGEIKIVEKGDLMEDEINKHENIGKILVYRGFLGTNILHNAVEAGIKGIICGGIDERELVNFLGYEIGVIITGQEKIGFTLIVTEGFGNELMIADKTFELLKKYEGKQASLNGATQIRAGVIRPEIIIPHEDLNLDQISKIEDTAALSIGLVPGMRVRIINNPHFGRLGYVKSLPSDLKTMESGSKLRVLEVTLDDGRQITIPRANVEIIGN